MLRPSTHSPIPHPSHPSIPHQLRLPRLVLLNRSYTVPPSRGTEASISSTVHCMFVESHNFVLAGSPGSFCVNMTFLVVARRLPTAPSVESLAVDWRTEQAQFQGVAAGQTLITSRGGRWRALESRYMYFVRSTVAVCRYPSRQPPCATQTTRQ